MSLFESSKRQLYKFKSTLQSLPHWQKITVGIVFISVGYAIYKKAKAKKKEPKLEYYPNVPHFTATKVVDCKNTLGECCIWDDRHQVLCWVDYTQKKFWTFDPKTNQTKTYDLPEEPGSFALCEDGSLFFCFASGPAFYDCQTHTLSKKLFEFEPNIRSRMNDGRCDRNGNFVVGGVVNFYTGATNPLTKAIHFVKNMYLYAYCNSSIHRINTDLSQQIIVKNVKCANSICFALDGKTMYYTDSFTNKINKLDYFNDGRIPNNERTFSDKYKGFADGSTVDANGNLWNASFGIGKVTCFDGNGEVIMVVDVPDEKCVTCCTFGGAELNHLFVTTLDGTPFGRGKGGSLYAVELPDIKGCKENRFKGTVQ